MRKMLAVLPAILFAVQGAALAQIAGVSPAGSGDRYVTRVEVAAGGPSLRVNWRHDEGAVTFVQFGAGNFSTTTTNPPYTAFGRSFPAARSTVNNFGFQTGGGLMLPIVRRVGVRVSSDLIFPSGYTPEIRIVAAAVVRLGGRLP